MRGNFESQLNAGIVKIVNATDQTVRAITIEVGSSAILDCPVDTGRARGSIQTSTGAPKTQNIERLDPTGAQALTELQQNAGGLGTVTYIASNLPYIMELEYGSSKQAPGGMFRRAVSRIQRIVNKAAQENRL